MVLLFENKTYDTFSQRLLFSIFKFTYVSNKYQFFYKSIYIVSSLIEILHMLFLLSVNYNDLTSSTIHEYGNLYNSNFDKTKFEFSNFNSNMSFILNFFDVLTKMSKKVFFIAILLFLSLVLLKIFELIYFMRSRVTVINAKGLKKFIFYFFSIEDQLMKTCLDTMIIYVSISTFSCKNKVNYFVDNIKCFQTFHIFLCVFSAIILFLILFYEIILCIFYDSSNLIENDNFGISDNSSSDTLYFIQKLVVIIINLYHITGNQEKFKLIIFFIISAFRLKNMVNNLCKFNNIYQYLMIFKTSFLTFYVLILFLYIMFKKKINIYVFFLITFSSIFIGYLTCQNTLKFKKYKLYTREKDLENYTNILFLIHMILNYNDKQNKIILNGFIQCYNIRFEEEKENCKLIDESLSLSKRNAPDLFQINIDKLKESIEHKNVKYLLTINNMLILGSVRDLISKLIKKKNLLKNFQSFKQFKLFEFLCEIIYKHSVKSHENSFYFKLLTAQIYMRKLNNITKTWFILSNFYESFNKFTTKQQFYVFELYQELHENLEIEDEQSIHNRLKIKNIMNLEKSTGKFIKKITKCTNYIKNFWLNYMIEKQKNIFSIAKFNDSLFIINKKLKSLQIFFDKIQKNFEDNTFLFYLYCCFLKNITNNIQLSEHIMKLLLRNTKKFSNEKTNNNNNTTDFIDDDYYKMINNEDLGLMIVSCNQQEIGKIKWCNNKLSNLLSFSRNDLSKLKINRIIPPIIANIHNDFIKSFIQTNKEYYSNITRASFLINSYDFMVPVLIYMNKIPKIKNGIEICNIVSKVVDNTFILYKNPEIKYRTKICFVLINEDGSIEAVDKNANMFLGIPNGKQKLLLIKEKRIYLI